VHSTYVEDVELPRRFARIAHLHTMNGKVALVSGGERGIGAAIVRRLATDGAAVAVNYRSDQAAADSLVSELNANGLNARAFQADAGDPTQCKRLVGQVFAEFGGLDALASNAGVEHFGALESITLAD